MLYRWDLLCCLAANLPHNEWTFPRDNKASHEQQLFPVYLGLLHYIYHRQSETQLHQEKWEREREGEKGKEGKGERGGGGNLIIQ